MDEERYLDAAKLLVRVDNQLHSDHLVDIGALSSLKNSTALQLKVFVYYWINTRFSKIKQQMPYIKYST